MTKGATAREEDYKRQVAIYLDTIMLAKGWTQSDIARAVNVKSTTINKATKLKHAVKYPTLLALEEASGIALPSALVAAAKALNAPVARVSDDEAEAFLKSSPEWRRMVKLGKQLHAETNPDAQRAIKDELQQLLTKVS